MPYVGVAGMAIIQSGCAGSNKTADDAGHVGGPDIPMFSNGLSPYGLQLNFYPRFIPKGKEKKLRLVVLEFVRFGILSHSILFVSQF